MENDTELSLSGIPMIADSHVPADTVWVIPMPQMLPNETFLAYVRRCKAMGVKIVRLAQ